MPGRQTRLLQPVQPCVLSPRQTSRFSENDLVTNSPLSKPAAEAVSIAPQDSMRALVGAELLRVESLLAEVLHSDFAEVNDLAARAASLGGKRLRPSLALLSALAVGRCAEDSIRIATTVELVHAASLVHDDVLDNATLRRHQPTIHAQAGAHRSIVLGDFLFTRAYGLAARCRSTLAARSVAAAASELCEGELRQQASIGNWTISEADYLDILRQKTGELCAVSCRLGAWSGGGDAAAARTLSRFGRKLGVAFQVVDDWLDLWGSAQVGKTLGTDLLQRKPTLPVIRLISTRPEPLRATLIELLERCPQGCEVRQHLESGDASAYSLARASRLISSAVDDLHQLPPSPARDCLEGIAQLCIRRTA